jgi:hypothetical protein
MSRNPRKTRSAITRRQFLRGAAAAAGCVAVSLPRRSLGAVPQAVAQGRGLAPRAIPPLKVERAGSQPKVVHVHRATATFWDYATGWYGDFVSQHQVTRMVDRGLMELTGTASRAAAWQALIPGYLPGQRVAIKVNLNNAHEGNDSDNIIDALIEPVNSVITGLTEIGVAESDIWVYDAVRAIPDRFRNGCDFAGVQFSGTNLNPQGFSPTEKVTFEPPGGVSLPDQPISQVLVDASYLVNMPIMKKHAAAFVTLSFKNHFGTIQDCAAVHDPTFPNSGSYTSDYNPLVDIYRNAHFADKTVLTIGDGLYGSSGNQGSVPVPWDTFGGHAPNSLFFSTDPVAIDCVMYDFLEAEAGVRTGGDDYLVLADQADLGVFEHRALGASDPADWYSLIDYVFLDLDLEPGHFVYLPFVQQ